MNIKKKAGTVILAALAIMIIAGCAPKEKKPESPALAKVNGIPVTVAQFQARLKLLRLGFQNVSGSMNTYDAKIDLLSQMIQEEMYMQEAKKLAITVSEDDVDELYSKTKSEYSGDFEKAITQEGLSQDDYKEILRRKLVVERLVGQQVYSKVKVDDGQARKYFNDHRREFGRKEVVRARQIVVDNEKAAKAVLDMIKGGADFAALAKAKSLSPDGAAGGDLGWFSKGDMPEQFDCLFRMKPQAISGIVKTPYGFHILKLEGIQKAADPSFEEAKTAVIKKLSAEAGEDEFAKWQEELTSRSKPEVDFDRLKTL